MTEVYEAQLEQIQAALKNCENEADRKNLQELEKDLKELINLSFIQSLDDNNEDTNERNELNKDEEKNSHKNLLNQKCRAPFTINQLESFHNAFIAEIEDESEEVYVKVFFLNPILDKMKPCDFYFSDRCNFEDKCKYSHGEIVAFSTLKPYQDPCYSLLKHKCHVLVKTDTLWKPATVISCSNDSKTCQVKLQSGQTKDCCFSDILPPLDTRSESDSSDLSSDDSDSEEDSSLVSTNILQANNTFGDWQKFTKGFGSRMLEKFGYIMGEGLGKNKDGISEPISAKIYIQGKSLDFNMEHNERKGQSTVEEKLKKDSLKQQKISERNYARNETDVFAFINAIGSVKPSSTTKQTEDIKVQSKAQLNISNFKIEEEIKRNQRSLNQIKESLRRQKSDSPAAKSIQKQVDAKQKEIEELQTKLLAVNNEQKSRNEKSKLTVF